MSKDKRKSHKKKGYKYNPGKEFRPGYKYYNESTKLRIVKRIDSDELDEISKQFYLCNKTGKSYFELLRLAASVKGSLQEFSSLLHYSNLRRHNKYGDFGWWNTICSWLRIYIPWWENIFRKTIKALEDEKEKNNELVPLPTNLEQFLANMSQLMGVDPKFLIDFVTNHGQIEQFLEANRPALGTLAELSLWELLAKKDPATVRWALPRLKPDVWGEKLPGLFGNGQTPDINIIEGKVDKEDE